jgi:hypothetical protein
VDYTLIDPALQGGFYVAYLLEDADHQGIRYSTGQLMVNLTNGQHEIRNNSSAWTPEELASARYISVWGMPTGLDPQNTTTNYTFTPRISVSFVAPPNTVTPPPPGGDWTAYDYDDSSWQFPATTSVAISAPPAPLPPFILPETQSVTHALALFPNAAIGERVFYRHKFTLPAGDIVSALLDAHVEDATPIGVYVNGTMLAYSSVIDPSVGDIYNRMNLAVPLELLHTPTVVRYPIDFTCTFTSGCNEIVQMFPVAGRIPTHMHTHLDAPVELEISGGIGLLCSLRAIDGPAGGGIVIQANVLVGETDATNTSTLTIDDAATTAGIYVYGVGDGVTPTHITGYTDITYADTAENILALCVENTSGSALETSYRLEITTGEVPPIGGCVPVNEFGGDTLGSFDDNYQLAGRALCTSGWTGFTSIVERGSDGTAGDAYLSFVFEGADQEPVNPSFGKGFFTATLPAGGTATPYTNFEFSTPEDRDAIRYVSLWTRPTGTSPQSPSTDYPIAASLSLTFNGCGPATSAQHPQVVWVM